MYNPVAWSKMTDFFDISPVAAVLALSDWSDLPVWFNRARFKGISFQKDRKLLASPLQIIWK